uniref:Uncharacterized protein n=1 Tax=Chrysemys picta bellii TaxID=8478 RepID=A0A8C3F6C2_CHRPI
EHFTGHVTSAKETPCAALDMLTSKRYLDSSTSAFPNSIWHSSTRRVNHRNQPNKAEVFYRKVDVICVKLEAFWELIIWQSQVAKACSKSITMISLCP